MAVCRAAPVGSSGHGSRARPRPKEWRCDGRLLICLVRLDAPEACSPLAQLQHHRLSTATEGERSVAENVLGINALRCRSPCSTRVRGDPRGTASSAAAHEAMPQTCLPALGPLGTPHPWSKGWLEYSAPAAPRCSRNAAAPLEAAVRLQTPCVGASAQTPLTSSAPCCCRKGAGPALRARTTESRVLPARILPRWQGP